MIEVATAKRHPIRPGTLCALDRDDPHTARPARRGLRLVRVFAQALVGDETHRGDGSYAGARE